MKKPLPDQYREVICRAKNRVEEVTGLRPTMERILKGFRALRAPPRLTDHMRCIVNNNLKCGSFWSSIPRYKEWAYCSFCRKRGIPGVTGDKQHMWIDCENNSQTQAWETAKYIWTKTTDTLWIVSPVVRTGPQVSTAFTCWVNRWKPHLSQPLRKSAK